MISGKALDLLEGPQKIDLEKDLIIPFINEGKEVYAYRTSEYIKDAGTPDRLKEVEQALKQKLPERKNLCNKQRAVFVDRDGTLNVLKGLLYKKDDIELINGVATAVKLLNRSDFLTIVITNQPAVARNLCTIEELEEINNKLETLLGEEGAFLDDLFYCPHHPDSGYPEENKLYKIKCECRKPGQALVNKSIELYNIDITKSWFVGDSTVDIETGKRAGTKTILVKTGVAGKDKKYDVTADYVCEDLGKAVEIILDK